MYLCSNVVCEAYNIMCAYNCSGFMYTFSLILQIMYAERVWAGVWGERLIKHYSTYNLFCNYENEKQIPSLSLSLSLSLQTAHTQTSSTIRPGSIIVLLMCLFIVVFVLWRKGFVLQQPGRIYSHLSRVNSIYGNFTNFRSRKSRRQTMAAKKRMSAAAFPVRRLVLLTVGGGDGGGDGRWW